MKKLNNIVVAMMRDPSGGSWMAQIHVEFEGTKAKDVLKLGGDTPLHVLEKARNAIGKRYEIKDGSIVLSD